MFMLLCTAVKWSNMRTEKWPVHTQPRITGNPERVVFGGGLG